MLLLKSLEITGFKSFAKKTVMDFSTPITAIVGPNGSGKSNVAEGFRFVLGEQSIKSLRGKKGEDLIFNGTTEGGKLNRAAVKLTFDNSSKFLPLDFSEVIIERIVHRDSVNEYLINGSSVRLKDIQELLASANIGSTGHHIISQGEADKILNASEKERKEMIEDALGLKIYQYKKEESERKLEKVQINIEKVESMRRELTPHIRFLKKQVEKIEKAKLLREELTVLYKQYLKREALYLAREKENIQTQLQAPQQRLSDLASELTKTKAVLAVEPVNSEHQQDLNNLERDLNAIQQEKNKILREAGAIEGEIRSILRLMEREQQHSVNQIQHSVPMTEVESVINSVRNLLDSAKNDNEKLLSVLNEINQIFDNFLQQSHTELISQYSVQYDQDIVELKVKQQHFEQQLTEIKQHEDGLILQIAEKQKVLADSRTDLNEAEKKILQITAEQNSLQGHLSTWQSKWEQLLMEEEDYKKELNEAMTLAGRMALDYDNEDIDGWDNEVRQQQRERQHLLEKIKIRLEEAGIGDLGIEKEFNEATERDNFLAKEIQDLQDSSAALHQLITELKEKIDLEFKQGVNKINLAFGEFFKQMFGGGSAELLVVKNPVRTRRNIEEVDDALDEETEMEDGIDIKIVHPFKKVKTLMMMSGGERALTSIALLFALSQVNPPPFIILDETDAALDEANSKRYGNMITALAKYSQLILITHNRETMSRAGVLYGVTMGIGGASKLLSIKLNEAIAVAK